MVRDLAIHAEPTKPAIREIEMNLLAQVALRPYVPAHSGQYSGHVSSGQGHIGTPRSNAGKCWDRSRRRRKGSMTQAAVTCWLMLRAECPARE
jgi:hypothetical protein